MVRLVRGKIVSKKKAKTITTEAKNLLREQLDEDTPKVDIEDVLKLLVDMAEYMYINSDERSE